MPDKLAYELLMLFCLCLPLQCMCAGNVYVFCHVHFYKNSWSIKSSLHTCWASALHTEPSLQPLGSTFKAIVQSKM